MGPGGLEPPTSPLSGVRSSQLSYEPEGAEYSNGGFGWPRTRGGIGMRTGRAANPAGEHETHETHETHEMGVTA